jgi:hypothetical protein
MRTEEFSLNENLCLIFIEHLNQWHTAVKSGRVSHFTDDTIKIFLYIKWINVTHGFLLVFSLNVMERGAGILTSNAFKAASRINLL